MNRPIQIVSLNVAVKRLAASKVIFQDVKIFEGFRFWVDISILVFSLSMWVRLPSWLFRLPKRYLSMFGECSKIDLGKILKFVQDKNQNDDWNECIDGNGMSLGRCVNQCDENADCEQDCLNQFKMKQRSCPCEVSHEPLPMIHSLWSQRSSAYSRKIVQQDVRVQTTIATEQRQLRQLQRPQQLLLLENRF